MTRSAFVSGLLGGILIALILNKLVIMPFMPWWAALVTTPVIVVVTLVVVRVFTSQKNEEP